MDISIDKGKFIYKMFDKLDFFHFQTVRMPSITSNIPSIIFHLEFAGTARSTLLLRDLLPAAKNLLDQMIN